MSFNFLKSERWRTYVLFIAALVISGLALSAFARLIEPQALDAGLVRRTEPPWPIPDPVLGYGTKGSSEVLAIATWGKQTVYRKSYKFDFNGARVTPDAPPHADTYLFVGDSFIFGQGLDDDETLPSQFARASNNQTKAVNLGVPGYSLNQVIRAFEAGLLDRFTSENVVGIVTWIIPAQLERVTGDSPWLHSAPRYVLEDGIPRHTGTFADYRRINWMEGFHHWLAQRFAIISGIGRKHRQEKQADLLVALVSRLGHFSREKFGAPLYLIYSWPDASEGVYDSRGNGGSMLIDVLERLSALDVTLISAQKVTLEYPLEDLLIPHDGHPSALTNKLVAQALARLVVARKISPSSSRSAH